MKKSLRALVPVVTILILASAAACGPPDDPEIVALAYVRATSEGDPETAISVLDIAGIQARVEEEIVVVESSGDESFLEDSIETLLWGLFMETRPGNYGFNATPALLDGNTATVEVTRLSADNVTDVRTVHLKNTEDGWRVSGSSLDSLVRYVIQRLEERY